MSILVLGTVALDTVKTPFGIKKNMLGGSAVHFSMAARLFTQVHLVANVGSDFPKEHLGFLKKKGLALDALVQTQGKTFSWSGEYKGDLNTALTIKTELGVLVKFEPRLCSVHKKIKNVFLANVDPDLQMACLKQVSAPKITALDSMNYWIINKRSSLLRMLKNIDIYVANDQEARSLTGESNLIKAAKSLRCLGPKIVLVKKGEHGVLFYSDKFIFLLPAYPAQKVIDPTGAGDTFAGGFMGYLAAAGRTDGASLKKAIAYGTICASFNVEGFGASRTARLSLADIEQRLAKFRKCLLF